MSDTDSDQPATEERIEALRASRRASRQPGGDPASTDPIEQARTARRDRNAR